MTIWELKALAEQKAKDEQLTEQQRNAWQNALKSVEINLKEREQHETIRTTKHSLQACICNTSRWQDKTI